MKIYVASSWRNKYLDDVFKALRATGHDVYDFRANGFGWDEAATEAQFVELKRRDRKDPERLYTAKEWKRLTDTPIAREGFQRDYDALTTSQAVVLVLPAGRSAHLEAGYLVGLDVASRAYGGWVRRKFVVYQPEAERPDLMLLMADAVCGSIEEVIEVLKL